MSLPPVPNRRIGPVFGQLYVTCAVLALTAILLPLYISTEGRPGVAAITIWNDIVTEGRGVSIAAALLILITAGVLLAAAQRPTSMVFPVLVVVAAVIGVLMVLTNPARPRDTVHGPGLAVVMTVSIVAAVTAVVHLVRGTRR